MSAQDDSAKSRLVALPGWISSGSGGWLLGLREALWRDRGFWLVIAAYLAAAELIAAHFHRTYLHDVTRSYLENWLPFCLPIPLVILTGQFARVLLRERPASPFGRLPSFLGEQITPERVAGMALYAALPVFLGAFTTIKTILPLINPFWADPLLADIDQFLHFGRDPWVWLQPLMGRHAVTEAVQVFYLPVWMTLTVLLPMYLCIGTRDAELRRRFLAAYLLAWIVNGTLIAGLMMSGGPAFYADFTGDAARFAPVIDYLAYDRGDPGSPIALQRRLLELHEAGKAGLGTGISEFPSMHVTIAVLCTLAASRIHKVFGYILAAFTAVILIGSVHLGWHYAIGGYFAAASTWGLWWLAGRLTRTRPAA